MTNPDNPSSFAEKSANHFFANLKTFVTPAQRHRGEDHEILQRRKEVYAAAKNNRPERWSGNCRNWDRIEVVTLNYEQAAKEQLLLRANG